MTNSLSAPELDEVHGDFNGQLFGFEITNAQGGQISFSVTPEQLSALIVYFFQLGNEGAHKNPHLRSKPRDIPADSIAEIRECGLGQGKDAQHATFLVGAGPLRVGFQTQISKLATVCEGLHQATRGGFVGGASKPPRRKN